MAADSVCAKMSFVILALSVFLLSARYGLKDFYHSGHSFFIDNKVTEILLPSALCCLVTSFIFLYWTSYLDNGRLCKWLRILSSVECFIGGENIEVK